MSDRVNSVDFGFKPITDPSSEGSRPNSRPSSAQLGRKRTDNMSRNTSPRGFSPRPSYQEDRTFKTAFKPHPPSSRPGSRPGSAKSTGGGGGGGSRPFSASRTRSKSPGPHSSNPSAGFVDPRRSISDVLQSLSEASRERTSPERTRAPPVIGSSTSLLLQTAKETFRRDGIAGTLKKRGIVIPTGPSKAEIVHKLFLDAKDKVSSIQTKIHALDAYSEEYLRQELARSLEMSKMLEAEQSALASQNTDIDPTGLAGHSEDLARIPGFSDDEKMSFGYSSASSSDTDSHEEELFGSEASDFENMSDSSASSRKHKPNKHKHSHHHKTSHHHHHHHTHKSKEPKISTKPVAENISKTAVENAAADSMSSQFTGSTPKNQQDLEGWDQFLSVLNDFQKTILYFERHMRHSLRKPELNAILGNRTFELLQLGLVPSRITSDYQPSQSGNSGNSADPAPPPPTDPPPPTSADQQPTTPSNQTPPESGDQNVQTTPAAGDVGRSRSRSPPQTPLQRLQKSAKKVQRANLFVSGMKQELAEQVKQQQQQLAMESQPPPTPSGGGGGGGSVPPQTPRSALDLAKRRLAAGGTPLASPRNSAPIAPKSQGPPMPPMGMSTPLQQRRPSRIRTFTEPETQTSTSASTPIISQLSKPMSLFSPMMNNSAHTPLHKLKQRLRVVTQHSLALDADPRALMENGQQDRLNGATKWVANIHKFCQSILQMAFTALDEVEKQTVDLVAQQNKLLSGDDERAVLNQTMIENSQLRSEIHILRMELEEERRSNKRQKTSDSRSVQTDMSCDDISALEKGTSSTKSKDFPDSSDPIIIPLLSSRGTRPSFELPLRATTTTITTPRPHTATCALPTTTIPSVGGMSGRLTARTANRLLCPNQRLMELWERTPLDKRRPKDLPWLVKSIGSFLRCKVLTDAADDRDKRKRSTLAEFVFENLRQLFGAKTVDENVVRLISSLFKHESEDVLVRSFFRMLREEWPTRVLNMYLSALVFLFVHKYKTSSVAVLFANPNLDVTSHLFLSRQNVQEVVKYLGAQGFFASEETLLLSVLSMCFPTSALRPCSGAANRLAMARQLSLTINSSGVDESVGGEDWNMEPELDQDRVSHIDFLFYLCDRVWSLGLVPSAPP